MPNLGPKATSSTERSARKTFESSGDIAGIQLQLRTLPFRCVTVHRTESCNCDQLEGTLIVGKSRLIVDLSILQDQGFSSFGVGQDSVLAAQSCILHALVGRQRSISQPLPPEHDQKAVRRRLKCDEL
ncbi:hypothetical protein M407DRAFT_101285 [Tulasnella calospora MUT 4182]|uniref:Uncharacterized protein n=1 Tax=Tulasnella calospora MUT 4182 TaxID=1051891 RepID=A0A0C3KSK0_9AGAM|nr:hypothetical protein M407DRAFT_101285 [Tulasnella calospora MUT 4182]